MEAKNNELNALVAKTAAKYGYIATAMYRESGKFNVVWVRNPMERTIDFGFTDWLLDAPEEILAEIIEVVFLRIFTLENPEYSPAVLDYIEEMKKEHAKQ